MGRPVDGFGFAFIPRSVVAQPKAFGVVAGLLEPGHGDGFSEERYRAAMLQHLMALTARQALLGGLGISPAEYVRGFDERGLSADRVRRVFRGETMAQLTDFAFWGGRFPEVAVAISEYTAGWVTSTSEASSEPVTKVDDPDKKVPMEKGILKPAQPDVAADEAETDARLRVDPMDLERGTENRSLEAERVRAAQERREIARAAELRQLDASRVRIARERNEWTRRREGRSPQHPFG